MFRLKIPVYFFLLLISVCFNSYQLIAQQSELDSLVQRVYEAKTDEEKLDAILVVCMRNDIDTETFNEFAFASKPLAEKSGDAYKLGMSTYLIAWAHYLYGYNDSARMAIDQTLSRINETDSKMSNVIFKLKCFKATTYQSEENNTEALRLLYPLLEDVQKSGNRPFIAQTMHIIAVVEGQQNNPEKTIEWEKQAIALLNENSAVESNIRSTILGSMAKAYMQLNQNDSAIFYNNQALENFRMAGDLYNLAITLQYQAKLYTITNDLVKAEYTLKELTALNEQIHMGDGDLNYWMAFVNFYMKANRYDEAISLIQKRLQNAGETMDRSATKWGIRLTYYEALAACYHATGKDHAYGETLKDIIQAKDSLYEINSAEALADLQTKYDVQKKENTIIEQKLQLNQKNLILIGALFMFVLISLFIWNYFRNNARKQELKMQIQMREDKIRSEQAVKDAEENERKRIAADLHDNLGSYAASMVSNITHLEQTTLDKNTLQELKGNSQAMVSILSDTIWALKKEKLFFTAISDRVKVLLQRLNRSYPEYEMEVQENIDEDILLSPSQAYQLFCIIQEAVNNALKHSEGNKVIVDFLSQKTGEATVHIIDNGIGNLKNLDASDSGNGIFNMRHRSDLMGWKINWIKNVPQGIVVEVTQNNPN